MGSLKSGDKSPHSKGSEAMRWGTWMSWGAVIATICGCQAGQKSYAQSGLPRDPAAYFPKDSTSGCGDAARTSAGSTGLTRGSGSGDILRTSNEELLERRARELAGSGSDEILRTSYGAGSGSVGESTSRVLATVNGVPIMETELEHAMFPVQLMPVNDPESARRRATYTKLFLERLIDVELLTQDMNLRFNKSPGGKRTIEKLKDMAEREFETTVHKQIKDMQLQGEDEFKTLLKQFNLTYERRRDFVQRSMIADQYEQYLFSLVREEIGQRQIEDYYREHIDEFTPQVDTFEWEDIFLDFSKYPEPQRESAQARAFDIVQRLRAGAKVADMLEYDDGDSRSRGGRGDGSHRGQVQPPEVEPVLIKLKDGEIGPLVVMQTGIHIVRMVHRQNAHEVQPFDAKMQKLIREKLQQDIGPRLRKHIMDDLHRKAQIEYVGVERR
jgi:hypothetical protein